MSKTRLTDLAVSRIREPGVYWDALPGFGLWVGKKDKRWLLNIKKPGAKYATKERIGQPGVMGIAEARNLAIRIKDNPSLLNEMKGAEAELPDDTVSKVLDRYAREYLPRLRTKDRIEKDLRAALAEFADEPVGKITRRDIIRILNDIRDDGRPVGVNRVQAFISRFLGWCCDEEIIDANPAARIPKRTPENSRDRVLSDGELAKVWHAAGELRHPFGGMFRLAIATGQRKGECAAARWSQIQGDLWELPRELTKSGRRHEVPLSPLALRVLKEVPQLGMDHIFASGRAGDVPPSGFSRAKARLDRLCGVSDFHTHDYRRCCATWLGSQGYTDEVIGAVLNHARKGVTSRYNRSEYLPQKREALAAWGAHLEKIVSCAET